MRIQLKRIEKIDLLFIGVASMIPLVIGVIGWRLMGPPIIVISLSVAAGIILLAQLEINQRQEQNYRQIEALLSLLAVIKPKRPLPPMRDWAISPDIANIIVLTVLERKPRTILECGSGVSTILMSYCVKELGQGHIWSLDHDKKYADATREAVKMHGLEDAGTIIHAPLKETRLKGKSWLWYDTASLKKIGPVDLLVIDGPPQKIQKMARYPALPLLAESLSDNAIIIIDDASIKSKKVIRAWKEEFRDFRYEFHNTEKGTLILRKK